MHAETGPFAVVGSVCMMLALVLAWCLAGVRSSRFVKKCFPNPQYLLKAHLDFLMMTGLLFVFSMLFGQLRLAAGIPNKSREWSCSTANPRKRSKAFQATQSSIVASAASLGCCRRWLESAWDAWSFTPASPARLRTLEKCSVSITRRPARMAALSTDSSHRVVPYAHGALVTDQTATQTSSRAILDVVHAARSGSPLEKP
jgi:hypothetical protein